MYRNKIQYNPKATLKKERHPIFNRIADDIADALMEQDLFEGWIIPEAVVELIGKVLETHYKFEEKTEVKE